ncbi:MAG: glycosyltransferase [Halarcobacter sp.]
MIVSICIPTLNRSKYLEIALKSIFSLKHNQDNFQICISNNNSDEDYTNIENLITKNSKEWKIKYKKHDKRLELDNNIQYVTSMAEGEYVYYLGDDDLFITEDLIKLLNLLQKEKPDLLVFNSNVINKDGEIISICNNFELKKYTNAFDAFKDLQTKCTFGSILVKRVHLDLEEFKRYYGSSHAYGYVYWIKFLNEDKKYNIVVPDFPCSCIRAAEKNYNFIKVWYRDIPFGLSIYFRYLEAPENKLYVYNVLKKIKKYIFSVKFIARELYNGAKRNDFYVINPVFTNSIRFNLNYLIAFFIVKVKIYTFLKKIKIKVKNESCITSRWIRNKNK